MFGLFKRKSRDRVTFEEQLRILGGCGIALSPGVAAEALFESHGREEYEKEPYWLLLCTLGGEAELPEQAGPSGYPSDDMWHLDTECIEDDGAYAAIAQRLATISKGALALEDIEDHVDVEEGEAWLSFRLGDQFHRWEAKVEDDWLDPAILSKFAQLLEARGGGRRFTYIDLKGQDCLIGCATAEQRKALADATGLKVEWLA